MIYYFMTDNILLHQSNALDASDDVFRLIKRELLKNKDIQKDKRRAALYIKKVPLYREERSCFIYK